MRTLLILAVLVGQLAWSQEVKYPVSSLDPNLKESANAVIRNLEFKVEIESRKSMKITRSRVVTILNEAGLREMEAREYYEVSDLEASIQDRNGITVKKFKRRDFRDEAVSGSALISDNRVLYLDYTPTDYPFTLVYHSVTKSPNTAFLPAFYPLDGANVAVEQESFTVTCPSDLGFKFKEYNFEGFGGKKTLLDNGVRFEASNLSPIKYEQYSPSLIDFMPYVLFGVEQFHLEGVDGNTASWESFSSWMYGNLLGGTGELEPATIAKVRQMTAGQTDDLAKAKILYKYMQDKTRYVAIMLGIGGWKPMKAKDVDRLGYGDCKALSNYMRALLEAVGVQSEYAVIYGGQRRDLMSDFVSMQGNHVILSIPYQGQRVWLECTSQQLPFGFLGDFTDNRMALLVKPSGGELVRTTSYLDNLQRSSSTYTIDASGTLSGVLEISSIGLRFDERMSLPAKSVSDLKDYYKEYLSLNNLSLNDLSVNGDMENVRMVEKVSVRADRYAEIRDGNLFFAPNAFGKVRSVPQRYRTRNNPFSIDHDEQYEDECQISIPQGFKVETLPAKLAFSDKYGDYESEVTLADPSTIRYRRVFRIKKGDFTKEDYAEFRKFMEQAARADNSKIVLNKI